MKRKCDGNCYVVYYERVEWWYSFGYWWNAIMVVLWLLIVVDLSSLSYCVDIHICIGSRTCYNVYIIGIQKSLLVGDIDIEVRLMNDIDVEVYFSGYMDIVNPYRIWYDIQQILSLDIVNFYRLWSDIQRILSLDKHASLYMKVHHTLLWLLITCNFKLMIMEYKLLGI